MLPPTATHPLELLAPAKLNLCLHIVGRRPDGYHLLQTVFQLLDQGDLLRFRPAEHGPSRLLTDLPGLPVKANLVTRAINILEGAVRQRCGAMPAFTIELIKRMPAGGGLGGGSSDAATTLLGLNFLWGDLLTVDELAELGLSLGADIPLFVRGHSAWAQGIGEQLQPWPGDGNHPEKWYVVIHPGCEISTATVFADPRLTRNTPKRTIAPAIETVFTECRNDCEPVVRDRWPEVGRALDWANRKVPARLTGTGACLFAHFDTQQEALQMLHELPEGCTGFLARGIATSPVLEALRRARPLG